MSAHPTEIPSSILIVGSGVFGLSTAWALCKNPLFKNTSITLVDRQPFPTPDGSSIDSSRIIRPDYASPPYTRLASRARTLWRTTFAPSHYHETGLCVTASGPSSQAYVSASLANVRALGTDTLEVLPSAAAIHRVCGLTSDVAVDAAANAPETEPASGSSGYVNWSSGWADAEGAMRWLRREVEALDRVTFVVGTVQKLLIDHATATVSGVSVTLAASTTTPTPTPPTTTSTLTATLTVLATGAWTPSLLDLRGIARATGHPLCYLSLPPALQTALASRPTLLNLSSGLFMLPPARHGHVLKIARHGHGYTNPTTIPHPEAPATGETAGSAEATITVSLPRTHVDDPAQTVPREAQRACWAFLAALHPALTNPSPTTTTTNTTKNANVHADDSTRALFNSSRICWYTDTPTGDFLICYHPRYTGLFVATGGSGHAFKFLPVMGECVVDCMLGRTPEDFRGRWEWPGERVPEERWEGDGSRGGPKGRSKL
ncbi:FAD dependent oxidoreductase [Massariosphaeria phaeospora]|uniref:FAD dependent oxidoreductase n=1 Tax=Massariosphaeria phaeospora TaxID=100035 RepID=A0A7C8M8Z5_9PLEO|nr:FAD dependent oxidoreductase [Massariosphaeria phaeospora]